MYSGTSYEMKKFISKENNVPPYLLFPTCKKDGQESYNSNIMISLEFNK